MKAERPALVRDPHHPVPMLFHQHTWGLDRRMNLIESSLLRTCWDYRGGKRWRLMIFCARATRGLRKPSLGLMARLGVPVGGRVRKSRAVEDQSASIPEERKSELAGIIRSFVRYTR